MERIREIWEDAPVKERSANTLYECVTSVQQGMCTSYSQYPLDISYTNRSETLASGKIASGYDICHHLRLTKFCTEPQGVVDKDTRKHLSTENLCSESMRKK